MRKTTHTCITTDGEPRCDFELAQMRCVLARGHAGKHRLDWYDRRIPPATASPKPP